MPADAIDRCLAALPRLLRRPLERSGRRMSVSLLDERVELRLEGAAGAGRFDIVLYPKHLSDRAGYFSQTRDLYVCYASPAGSLALLEEPSLAEVMDELSSALRSLERRFSAGQIKARFRAVRPGTPDASLFVEKKTALRRRETPQGDAHVLRINLWCNQNCPFCFVDLNGSRSSLAEIEARLDSVPPDAPRSLSFSGGEPGSESRLPEIARLARAKGFKDLLLETNGVYLSKPGRVGELVEAGLRIFFMSFHSHVPDAYDKITGSKNQFPLAVAGLRNILACDGAHVNCNIVVNRLNLATLSETVAFLHELRRPFRKRIGIYLAWLNDAGQLKAPELAVSLEEAAPRLKEAVARARKCRLPVSPFEGNCSAPVCVLGQDEGMAPRRRFSQEDVSYQESFADAGPGGRAKSPKCRECVYDACCRGVPVEYARRFGVSMLTPIRSQPA
jgi:hypothetical protein